MGMAQTCMGSRLAKADSCAGMVPQGDTDEEVSGYNGIIPLAARTQQGFDALIKSIQAAPGTRPA